MPDTPDVDALEIAAGAHTGGNAPGQAKRRAAVQTLADLARKATLPAPCPDVDRCFYQGMERKQLLAALTAANEQVSELQSATKNDATRIITEYIPWQSNASHPRRVVLAYLKHLESSLTAANARADEAEAERGYWRDKALGYETAMFLSARAVGREWEPGHALMHIINLKRQMDAADRMYDILSHSAGANEVTVEYAAARKAAKP